MADTQQLRHIRGGEHPTEGENMSESNQEQYEGSHRQDPSEQYRTDQQVETSSQPDSPSDVESATTDEGSDEGSDEGDAPDPLAAYSTKAGRETEHEVTTDRVLGEDYTVDPNRGYRLRAGEPAVAEDSDEDSES